MLTVVSTDFCNMLYLHFI